MRRCSVFVIAAVAGRLAFSAGPAEGDVVRPSASIEAAPASRGYIRPPVLRKYEPPDSNRVRLPGAVRKVSPPPEPSPSPVVSASVRQPVRPLENTPPVPKQAPKPVLPPDFERDSAQFCQKRIGQWNQPDAYNLFGDPLHERPAYGDNQVENGRILAYSDPTGRYRELELDFDAKTGLLRTVFVYPWSMTWAECRRLWGGKVTTAEANNGRKFYSFLNRRLDVLVEPGGKVISLGLY